jgi:Retinoic acid induced 16-like protein
LHLDPTDVLIKEEFPLFYLLIDYVHHEGKVGDFARTGLLYIIEAASSSADLEKWIVESDLATLMASGLGALYSQLSRLFPKKTPAGNCNAKGFQKARYYLSYGRSTHNSYPVRLFI